MPKFVTVKIWKETQRLANVTRAHLGESLVSFFHRLTTAEHERVVGKKEKK